MSILPIVLLGIVFFGLAGAAYTFVSERARRAEVERAIGGSESTEIRRRIRRPTMEAASSDSIKAKLLRRAPSVWAKDKTVQERLIQAGHDSPTAPLAYSMARVVSLLLFPMLAFLIVPKTTFIQALAIIVSAAMAGFILPVYYLLRAVRLRQEKIRRSLPDALDLLVVCVEAGISLDAAILRVAKDLVFAHPELASELAVVNRKTNAGIRREEALRGLWERTGVEEIRTLVASLIQSEKWGSSSARVLRVGSETLRRKRRQSAERRAATAPTKMVVPLALLIFPALFVVILGPAVFSIIKGLSGRGE